MAKAPPQKRVGTASAKAPKPTRARAGEGRSDQGPSLPNRSLNPPGCRNRFPSRELTCASASPSANAATAIGAVFPGRTVHVDPRSQRTAVFQPLHQLPLRTDRVEGLQEHCPLKAAPRDRRAPDRRIVCACDAPAIPAAGAAHRFRSGIPNCLTRSEQNG